MAVAPTQSSANSQVKLPSVARALVQHGALRPDQAIEIAAKAELAERGFQDELIASGTVGAAKLAALLAAKFGHPLLDIAALDTASLPSDLIEKKLIFDCKILPISKRGNRISIASSDPTNMEVFDRIKFATECQVDVIVAEHDKLMKLVEKLGKSASDQLNTMMGDVDDMMVEQEEKPVETESDVDDAPIVKFLQSVLIDAIQQGASDLHFEPYEKFFRIRFRIDGELREISQPPYGIKDKLISRIKVISRLDISEKRVPQDGRMKLVLSGNKAIDFRVSSLPTLFGEKIVMRILDPSQAKLGIDALGYEPEQKSALLEAVSRPYGMVLVTGPTGSGKTVSLYTCLNILNKPGINISTAEDPAEINLPGINQVNVNDKAGLTFSAALKSFLRQDPDIIMVGEIRDLETADISIKAAQTGHLVLSTLHTNDAPTTMTRMVNMGVAPFNIATAVSLITAQRLGRRLCTCKAPADLNEDALLEVGFREEDLDGKWQVFKPVGCERCNGSGYKGRVGIYQVMPVNEEMQAIILDGGNAMQIADSAKRAGVSDLRRSGLRKVMAGLTSIDEVIGCTNE